VIQKVSCPDDGAGGDSRRGEPYENITHHSFNSGTDDRCRSVAHNACQRLGLGLARRMGMGRCRAGTRNGSSSWQRARREFILRLRLPDGYGTGFGYAANSYLRPIATAARLCLWDRLRLPSLRGATDTPITPIVRRHVYAVAHGVRRNWQ